MPHTTPVGFFPDEPCSLLFAGTTLFGSFSPALHRAPIPSPPFDFLSLPPSDPAPHTSRPSIFRRCHFRPSGEHGSRRRRGIEAPRPCEHSPGSPSSGDVAETLALLVPASLAEYGTFFVPLATAAGNRARSAPPPSLSPSLLRHPIYFEPLSLPVDPVSLSVPLHTPYNPLPTLFRHSPHKPVPPNLLAPSQRPRCLWCPRDVAVRLRWRDRPPASPSRMYAACRVLLPAVVPSLAARHMILYRLRRPIVVPPVSSAPSSSPASPPL
ncbi:hypothetical protein AURDEDRAFT_177481 [Auricularia subglabra TFB-10046 SS5]|uniref:Uncharacterized protein n=1 Tax=Auricularia subglabra (strain TFB-10046 / SS5) TaxID=717982 RepID=J0WNN5_AURST|nr:hypothetical protein AURDEDRAFT_177481 [Auricularia subglabra TFB-10046 SS5]